MRPQFTGLWQQKDFLKLWGAQTTSVFGTHLASLAYSLTAIVTLQATPFEIGLLNAIGAGSAALVGLFAGVMADRIRRRPLLIGADLGRAVLSATIPLAFVLGVLHIGQLYVVRFLFGALAILSEVAYMAFLPSLVGREQLVEGNSKFSATESLASMAGPSLSGVLVQALTAPIAVLVDAVSFVFSAAFIWLIRTAEPEPPPSDKRRSVWAEIAEGLRVVFSNPVLRALSQGIALHFLFILIILTIFVLYAVRELGIGPIWLGIILAALGPGSLSGALVAGRAAKRFGPGRTMIAATLLNALAVMLIPLAGGSFAITVTGLMAAHFLLAFGIQIHGINLMSLRQAITPHRLQGRMNASFRFINVCAMMIGSLLAGVMAEMIGFRLTLAVAACGMLLPFVRLLLSPVRDLNEQQYT